MKFTLIRHRSDIMQTKKFALYLSLVTTSERDKIQKEIGIERLKKWLIYAIVTLNNKGALHALL